MTIWERHITGDLPAFLDQALPPKRMQQISAHLRHCKRCLEEYEGMRFAASLASHLGREEAPAGLWRAVEARWEELRTANYRDGAGQAAFRRSWLRTNLRQLPGRAGGRGRPELALTGAVALLLSVSAALVWCSRHTGAHRATANYLTSTADSSQGNGSSTPEHVSRFPSPIDLAAYIEPVKASETDRCVRVISQAAPHFVGVGKAEAFKTAGLGHSLANKEPLPGYRLAAYRVCAASAGDLAQLVYSRGEDAFCVFVAPRNLKLVTGREAAVDAEVRGIRCQKIDCPQQQTYLFDAGRFRCVLVSKSLNEGQAATVMKYFISAHQPARQGPVPAS